MYKKLRLVSGVTICVTVPCIARPLFTLSQSFSKLLLNTHTYRYEAGAERGKNVFGLLPAEPPDRESGDPHAAAAVSDRAEWAGVLPHWRRVQGDFPEALSGPQFPICGTESNPGPATESRRQESFTACSLSMWCHRGLRQGHVATCLVYHGSLQGWGLLGNQVQSLFYVSLGVSACYLIC